jgi:hypothetical protein
MDRCVRDLGQPPGVAVKQANGRPSHEGFESAEA